MKYNWLNIVLKGLCTLLLITSSLHADEEIVDTRIEVEASTLSADEEQQLQEAYAVPEEEVEVVEYAGETSISEESVEQVGCQACKTYSNMYVIPKTIANDLIEMVDGSTWIIHPDDSIKTKLWAPGVDKIMISQNSGTYKHRLNVVSNGKIRESVRAKLSLTPYSVLPNGKRPLAIAKIDQDAKVVTLTDGSRWSITSWDNYMYHDLVAGDMKQRRWVETDMVFVGYNSDWMNSWLNGYRRPFILVNINLDKIVRAQFLGY